MNDRGPGKRIILPFILVALFLLFSSLSVVYIRSEQRLNRLVAEYQVDKTAAALLERVMNEVVLVDLYQGGFRPGTGGDWSPYDSEALAQQLKAVMPASVRGFGIYRSDGTSLSTLLAAPSAIETPTNGEEESFRFEQQSQSVALVRRIGASFHGPAMRMRGMGSMMWGGGEPSDEPWRAGVPLPGGPQRPGGLREPGGYGDRFRPAYLYLNLALPSFFRERSVLDIALLAVPLAVGAILLTIGLLFNRNRQYRERIEAQRNLVRLGEIARTLSHEIKNPLSAIKLQTAILRRTAMAGHGSPPSGGAQRGAAVPAGSREIELIEEETERVSRLVERIGEYLRDPLGKPEPVDLFQFINDLLARFPWPVRPPEPPTDRLAVRFDPDRLRTVLENLVKNGVESAQGEARPGGARYGEGGVAGQPSADGGSTVPVSVMLQSVKGKVELIVADHGPGISQDDADRLFDPFFTTKVRGMGVGLAISKRFVEAAGGSLRLRPGRNGGAEAVVTLPRWAT